jgi:hypothetical protein
MELGLGWAAELLVLQWLQLAEQRQLVRLMLQQRLVQLRQLLVGDLQELE